MSKTKSSKFFNDNKLNWIDYVSGKIVREIGIITWDRKYFSNKCLGNLYFAFIYHVASVVIKSGVMPIRTLYQNNKFCKIKL